MKRGLRMERKVREVKNGAMHTSKGLEVFSNFFDNIQERAYLVFLSLTNTGCCGLINEFSTLRDRVLMGK